MHPISQKTSLWPMHPISLNNPTKRPGKPAFQGVYSDTMDFPSFFCVLHPGGHSFRGAVFCKVYFAFFAKHT